MEAVKELMKDPANIEATMKSSWAKIDAKSATNINENNKFSPSCFDFHFATQSSHGISSMLDLKVSCDTNCLLSSFKDSPQYGQTV